MRPDAVGSMHKYWATCAVAAAVLWPAGAGPWPLLGVAGAYALVRHAARLATKEAPRR